ncbi:hypothetical protein B0H16DRAFT_1808027 [Mycena metata]|uniref:Uncharacterized protein n=1 Tax=Mycena metata TaxID=1033252 RepID=A0AAD7H7J2_9AGAR|nr:hypothetical protein B0H16DRAFT_1808027 [Mycena metata]
MNNSSALDDFATGVKPTVIHPYQPAKDRWKARFDRFEEQQKKQEPPRAANESASAYLRRLGFGHGGAKSGTKRPLAALEHSSEPVPDFSRRSTKATSTSKRLKAPQAPGESALDYLDRLRYGPRTDKPTTGRKSTPAIAPTTIIPAALTGISSPALPSHKHTSPDAKFPVRESDKEYTVFQREDDWSEASDEDDYDPAGGLPYYPRWNISRRRADAIIAHATRLSDDQLKSIKVAVVAQIVQVGAVKKALEKAEIGPAPVRFQYVQFNDDIFLKKDSGDGSLVYVGSAETVIRPARPAESENEAKSPYLRLTIMPRGLQRASWATAEQHKYLESHWPAFQPGEKQLFWKTVEWGWFERWPVGLGLEFDDSLLAHAEMRKKIRNWFYNRWQRQPHA